MKIIKYNPDKPLDWDGISWNPKITWDIIKDNPDKRLKYINLIFGDWI